MPGVQQRWVVDEPVRGRRPRPLIAAVTLLAVTLAGCGANTGQAADTGALRVVDATIDVPVNPSTGAVRFVVRNGTATADTLIGVTSDAATSVAIHRSLVDAEGRSTMAAVARLAIPARSEVTFAPGGLHVMLTGLRHELRAGDRVTVTLTFARAGTRTVSARVVEPGSVVGAESPSPMEHLHGT